MVIRKQMEAVHKLGVFALLRISARSHARVKQVRTLTVRELQDCALACPYVANLAGMTCHRIQIRTTI